MSDFVHPYEWEGPTFDPNDEHFGDIIETISIEKADDYRAVLVGEPFDAGQVSVRGAMYGPEGLRQSIAETKTHHLNQGPVEPVGDLGDIEIPHGRDLNEIHELIKSVVQKVHAAETFPILLGGGHDLGYPNSISLLDLYNDVGVINFDAHADVREVVDYPYNGTPFRQALEDGLAEYAFLGGRHFETSTPYVKYMQENGCTIVPAPELTSSPIESIDKAFDQMGYVDAIHVSCDLDVLDISVASGLTAPTPGGLNSRELFECLNYVVQSDKVVSFDLIGCAPPLESLVPRLRQQNIGPTAIAGGRAIAHVLSGLQEREAS